VPIGRYPDPGQTHERFTRIYEAYYPAVLAYCARRVSRSDAEDVANEVFVVLWRQVDTFDEESPLPWLYRVAHGSLRNRWKSTRRRFELTRRLGGLPSESADAADVVVVRRERDRAVLAALGRMRAGDQEVLRLAIWEELAASEIAVVLGCSVSAAEQRLHRAKKRLARVLSPSLRETVPSPESLEKGGRPS
jgi:RNA polymerase sigma-70 factor (ECF subfamily)